MTVNVNYWVICPLIAGLMLLIIWLIKRDRKDEKDFEKTVIKSDRKHAKHLSNEGKNLTN